MLAPAARAEDAIASDTGSHAAAHESPQPAMPGHSAHAVMQQNVSRAGRPRPAIGADHAIGDQCHFHLFGFEPLVQELGRAGGEDLHHGGEVFGTQTAHAARQLQVVDEVAHAGGRKLRRRGQQQPFHYLRDTLQLIFVGRIDLRVAARELGDLGQRLGAVLPHEEMAAVGKSREEGRILGVHLISVALQFQFANDALLQQAGQVSRRGDPITRPDLFGDRTAAHHLAALQHQHRAPGAGQVGCGDQAVMTAAYNDCVVFRHYSGSAYLLLKATTASGGRVTTMLYGRSCLGMSREEIKPPLPTLLPPKSSESVFRTSS